MPPAPLGKRLRERIRAEGPLPWRAFMDAALYDPDGGFYTKGSHPAGLGKGSEFVTSPTLHPFFSACVARDLAAAWREAGRPRAWSVVEFGAGTGVLARDAMAELRRLGVPATWTGIDVRPHPGVKDVAWASRPPARYDAAVANEFLDALPFDVYECDGGTWHELGVGLRGEAFTWERLAPGAPGLPAAADGQRRVRMPANGPWLDGVAAAGAAAGVLIDYGELGPAREVRAFKGHDFADPLSEPGTVDLTADVDFEELGQMCADRGYRTTVETQERFLLRHGAFEAINKVDRTTRQGASEYLRFRQLLLPTGFGSAFKVATLRRA